MWYVRKIDYDSELYHHGIKGQKWGDKNGPPYPLGASDHSSSEIKEGRKGWSKEAKKEKINTRKNKRQLRRDKRAQKYYNKADKYQSKIDSLTKKGRSKRKINRLEKKKQKALHDAEIKKNGKLTKKEKAIVIGATVVAAYATYKFIDSGHARQMITKGKQALGVSDSVFKKDLKLADKNLTDSEIFDKVVKRINPDYGAIGSKVNCRRCTFSYEMSRRGYDVKATKTIGGSGQGLPGLTSAITKESGIYGYAKNVFNDEPFTRQILGDDNTKKNKMGLEDVLLTSNVEDNAKNIFKHLSNYPNGARGEFAMAWTGGAGHSMAFEIIKGKPIIFDCQTSTEYSSPEDLSKLAKNIVKASTTRLDNIELNEDFLMRWMENAS